MLWNKTKRFGKNFVECIKTSKKKLWKKHCKYKHDTVYINYIIGISVYLKWTSWLSSFKRT